MPRDREPAHVRDAGQPASSDPTIATGAHARDVAAELRASGGDAESEARFWRARAEALAAERDELHARLRALAERLPARHARLLACAAADMPREPDWPDPLAGWTETTTLREASVAWELPRLWARLGPPVR